MSKNITDKPTLASVFDGRICLGHVLNRGVAGWEGFTADDRSVGLFSTARQAANALFDEAQP
jgi:hypothetical protein